MPCQPMYDEIDRCGDLMDPALSEYSARMNDRVLQALMYNLWDYQPGEIERWEDDGGK